MNAAIVGDRLQLQVDDGEPLLPWTLAWEARGPQPATDVRVVVARGDTLPVDVEVPPGPPSFSGGLLTVEWRFEMGDSTWVVQREPGPPPRGIDPTAWSHWRRARTARFAAAGVFVVGIAVACVVASAILGFGAMLLPPHQAVLVWVVLGLASVGAVATVRTQGLPRLRRSRIMLHPGIAVLGGELPVLVHLDPRRAMAAGGFSWTLRCVERSARRVTTLDRGQARARDEWEVRIVTEVQAAVSRPTDRRTRLAIRVPAEAPPTLTAERREILWELTVRCGEDQAEDLVYVAPYREEGSPLPSPEVRREPQAASAADPLDGTDNGS